MKGVQFMSGSASYGKILKSLRKYHDYTQADLTEHLNITPQAYSNYEHNKRTPDFESMRKIAEFYKISLDTLAYSSSLDNILQDSSAAKFYASSEESSAPIPLSGAEAKMLIDYKLLEPSQQAQVYDFICFLKKNR